MEMYYVKIGMENMQFESVKNLLKQTYWAKNRTAETILKSMENSICYGVFLIDDNTQVGFARVVTDYSTTYYICDVVVDSEYRGIGIGKSLLGAINEDKENMGLMGILTTKDAQGLYAQYGFKESKTFMMKRRNIKAVKINEE